MTLNSCVYYKLNVMIFKLLSRFNNDIQVHLMLNYL